MLSPAHREVLARSGPAERPEERKGRLDGDIDEKVPEAHAVATSLETPDQMAPGPSSCGTAPGPPRELVLRGSAQGCPCPPAPTSSAMLQEEGLEERVPPGTASRGLGPRTPEPTAARQGLHHPAKPPRSKATKGPSQEPQGPPFSPSLAKASPGSPRGAPDSHPEQPRPADRKLCPSSVDASPGPKSTACPSLQEATRLIQEEFAFDGYLDNGLEALIMGTGDHLGGEVPWDQGVAGDAVHGRRVGMRGPSVTTKRGPNHLHEEPVSRASPPRVLWQPRGSQSPARDQPHLRRK